MCFRERPAEQSRLHLPAQTLCAEAHKATKVVRSLEGGPYMQGAHYAAYDMLPGFFPSYQSGNKLGLSA